jgi:Fur family ferric uptake transcriptional regulator
MFCMFGFAQKRTFESRDPLYEHRHLGTHHDHFICIRCGEINEFANDELEKLQLAVARQHQFHPLQHRMEIYGLCSECMQQRDENLPLILAARGERVRIVKITGGRELRARLADMGLSEGICLEVISNMPSGPSIVALQGSRLAIAVGMAQQIIVSHSCVHGDEEQ